MGQVGYAGRTGMPFRALTFDCYGTLIDWETGLLEALVPWVAAQGGDASPSRLLAAFAEVEPAVQRAHPRLPYSDLLGRVHGALARRLALPENADAARRFAASVGRWPAFPDTAEALGRLATRFRLVLVSNVDRRALEASAPQLGIDFDAVVTAEEVGAYKPDIRMFAATRRRLADLGCDVETTLHVAQSLFHDHVPAKALGFRTAWVDRRRGEAGWGATPPPGEPVTPDIVVASLTELATHLGV